MIAFSVDWLHCTFELSRFWFIGCEYIWCIRERYLLAVYFHEVSLSTWNVA
jgi:hypothetical protein